MPDDLFEVLMSNGVDGCVAVQADQSEDETTFLLDLADKYSFIKGVVGWLDLRANNIAERLDYFNQFPQLKGLRHVVQDEPDKHFMLRDPFLKGIESLAQYEYTYDILIYSDQIDQAIRLVKQFPEQKFVIDHIAKPNIKKGAFEEWSAGIDEIAKFQHVMCKISGMVTEADWQKWKPETFDPYMNRVLSAFGPERLMFGSDWPVCLLAADYAEVKGIAASLIDTLDERDKQNIWSQNAINFYNL